MKESLMKDLTKGPLWKKILIFSYPLMISNLLQVLFNLSDIAVVGQFAGPAALGSVGSTTTLVNLYIAFLIGMGCGVNVVAARFYGSKKEKDVSETVHSALILCLITGVFLLVFGIATTRSVLVLLKTKDELLDGAVLYMRIYFLGMPAMAIYNFGNGVFSAVGDTKKPLCYLSVAGAVNVILNLFFVIVCNMGVAGVAAASAISQYLSAFLIIRALFKTKEMYGLHMRRMRLTPAKSKMILSIGISSGLQNAIFQLANLFVQMGVNRFDATMVSGNAAASNADALFFDVMGAFYVACSSFIGQNFGAGNRKRVKQSYFLCTGYAFGSGVLLGTVLVIFGRSFLSVFTSDAAVIDAGMYRLVIMGSTYAFSTFMDCSIAASRGLGKVVVPTVIVLLGSCVFRIIWVYTVFEYFQTIQSLYLVYICSWVVTAFAEIVYFAYVYKKCKFIR